MQRNGTRIRGLVAGSTLLLIVMAVTVHAAPYPVERHGSQVVVHFAPDDVVLTPSGDAVHASLRTAPSVPRQPGAPSVPLVPIVIELPVDQTAAGISVEVDEVVLYDNVRLAAVAEPVRLGELERPAVRRADLFSSTYPAQRAELRGEGFARGHRLLTVRLAPLRWDPTSGQLRLATTVRLELELEPASDRPLERYRVVPEVEARYDRALAKAIGADPPPAVTYPVDDEPTAFVPSFPPSTDGSPVEYVIVTTDEMKLEFQLLANWRTQMGLQSVVRTVEWIEGFYPNGADRAEQLRFFLEDAYQHWGTLWVLLAGDTDVLPFRYATSLVQSLPEDPQFIPTDLYFACLDNNWNGDKDDRIGEGFLTISNPGDSADFFPELFVGRAPVSNSQEATDYVSKVLEYERLTPSDANYPGSVLFLAEDLGFAEGADVAETAAAFVHPWMKVVKLYESFPNFPGAIELNKEAAVDSVNNGFGWVHHVGHGFRNTMSVGDDSISNPDADGLTNGDRQSFVFAINCSSASIDFNSIGERWIKNPDGGAVGYVGTTRLAFPGVSQRYQDEFYRLAFEDSVATAGECLFMSRLPYIGDAFGDNFDRWTQLALILLGDPVLPLWTHAPTPLSATHAPSMTLGDGTFTIDVTNQVSAPVAGASVTLWAISQDYKVGTTDASGQAVIAFDPETADSFLVTATRRNFLPYEDIVPVNAPGSPFVYIQGVSIDDDSVAPSDGNGDALVDAGETVELTIALRNSGQSTATGVSATLTVEDGGADVAVLTGAVAYADIAPSSISQADHVVQVSPSSVDGFLPRLRIDVTTNEGSWSDIFVLPVYTIGMEQYSHDWFDPAPGGNDNGIVEAGETIAYNVELRNNGVGEAVDVVGTLRVVNRNTSLPDPLVTVTDNSATFGDMLPTVRVNGGFGFMLDPTANPADLLLELTIDTKWETAEVQLTDLTPPTAVDSLRALGNDVSIIVKWAPADDNDLLGYDVFRSSVPNGPFARVNDQTVVGTSFFEDYPLDPLTRYYYQIAARDSSANQGDASEVIAATTNPPLHLGWPIEVGQATTSGVKVVDLVPGGAQEVVMGADCVYAWQADGNEVRDGDNDPRTSGIFTTEGCDELNGFRSDAAVVDINGDGSLEIVIAGWGLSSNEGKLHVIGADGLPLAGWPRSLHKPFNWGSAAVGQLLPDETLEIVAMQGQNGIVYAFDAGGNELLDGDSNPATIGPFYETGSSFNYASPALGDLDGDLLDEIVVVQNSTLGRVFAIDADGTLLPGWPFATSGQMTASPTIANIDDAGLPEIIVASEVDSVFVLTADGKRFPGWPQPAQINSQTARTPSPIVVDLDQNGVKDVIHVANDGRIHVWDRNGTRLPGWENVLFAQTALGSGASESTPTVGDIDGDGQYEMVIGAEDGRLYAFNHDATEVVGFPIQFEGEVRSAAAIADLDGDGLVEIAVTGWDQNVYVWDLQTAYDAQLVPWPYFRRDLLNRGNLEPPVLIGVEEPAGVAPTRFWLGSARPNPFNPRTQIDLDVPASGALVPVQVRVYDVSGRLQRQLVSGSLEPGRHTITWDGRNGAGTALPTGLYFMHAEAGEFEATRKLLLLK